MLSNHSSSNSITDYNFITLLGTGASAQVFLADYKNEKRAVKIFQLNGKESLLKRFQKEIGILSRLNHPGISSLLDSGMTDQGSPYLAMEYIEGSSLDQYVVDRSLSQNKIISLLQQCGEIIQYAHERGVLHRDLKPANILVDKQGRVHILDFGIAKVINENLPDLTRLTMDGQILGTLPYMSPEQIQADTNNIAVTSDLYAVGIIAYELLAGCHPFELHGLGLAESLDRVLNSIPKPASTYNPHINEELDRILSQSISRNISDRYLSAKDFVDDLTRFSNGEKVRATAPNTWDEMKQIFVRHKLPVSLAIFTFLMATLAAGVSSWFAINEKKARQETEIQMQKANIISDFLIDMLASANPDLGKGSDLTVRELVLGAAENIKPNIKDPILKASIHCTLADSLRSLGNYREAHQQVKSGLAILSSENTDMINECHLVRGIIESAEGERDAARKTFAGIKFVEGSKNWISIQIELATMDGAEGDLKASFDRLEKVLTLPENILPEKNAQRLEAMHVFASMLREDSQFEKAEEKMTAVIKLKKEVYGSEHPETLFSLNDLGAILINKNEFDNAEVIFNQILEVRTKVYGKTHTRTVSTAMNLLNVLVNSKKYDKADQLSEELLIQSKAHPLEDEKMIQIMSMRGFVLEDLGNLKEAERLYRAALSQLEKKQGRSIIELFPLRNNLAMLLMNSNRHTEAHDEFNKLLIGLNDQLGKNHVYYAIIENNYGESLGISGEPEKALEHLNRSHKLLIKYFGEDHVRVIKSSNRIASLTN